MPASKTVVAAFIFFGLAFSFVGLRCYSRFALVKSIGPDDVCVIFSIFSSAALTYCIVLGDAYGAGKADGELDSADISGLIKSLWGALTCFCVGFTLVKNSAMLQCLRFILYGKMRIFCWVVLGVCTVFGTVSMLLNTFHCTPIRAYWDRGLPGASCLNLVGYWYFASGGVILTDVVCVAIPVVTVKGLNMPKRQKYALISVFGLGVFVCICSVVRIHYMALLGKPQHIVRTNASAAVWSALELNIGIICVCVPPLKPVFVKFAPSVLRGKETNSNISADSGESGEMILRQQAGVVNDDTL